MENLVADLRYSWAPFIVNGHPFHFSQHKRTRLHRGDCSWWGPAVYKWEGTLNCGHNSGKRGILIGETSDLRQRIKQYVSGTQERGNKLWRESFLELGNIQLYILQLEQFNVSGGVPLEPNEALTNNNLRLAIEQLLIHHNRNQSSDRTWIVNARN